MSSLRVCAHVNSLRTLRAHAHESPVAVTARLEHLEGNMRSPSHVLVTALIAALIAYAATHDDRGTAVSGGRFRAPCSKQSFSASARRSKRAARRCFACAFERVRRALAAARAKLRDDAQSRASTVKNGDYMRVFRQ